MAKFSGQVGERVTIGGKTYELAIKDYTVTDVQHWSETRVSGTSSGGGGFLHNGTGTISAPTVSITSSVKTTQRLFLTGEAGDTLSFDTGTDFVA